MPSEQSARQSVRRAARNQAARSAAKTYVRSARRSLAIGSPEEAQSAVRNAMSSLDLAVKRGALHTNNASRRKSRLAKQLNIQGETTATPKSTTRRRPRKSGRK